MDSAAQARTVARMAKTRRKSKSAPTTKPAKALTPETLAMVNDVKSAIQEALDGTEQRSVIVLVQEALDRHPDADPELKDQLTAALSPDPSQAPSVGAAIKMARHLIPQVL